MRDGAGEGESHRCVWSYLATIGTYILLGNTILVKLKLWELDTSQKLLLGLRPTFGTKDFVS